MAFGTLFTFPGDHPRSIAIKAVAKVNNLELVIREDFKSPDHLKVNKLGKVPAFVDEDGFKLVECIAIAIYVTSQDEKTTLLGKNKKEYAEILRWMSYFNTEVVVPIGEEFQALLGFKALTEAELETARSLARGAIDVVEEHLEDKSFLVGDVLSLADIFCAALISLGFINFFGRTWREVNPHVTRWFTEVVNNPIYASVTEKIEFLEVPKEVKAAK